MNAEDRIEIEEENIQGSGYARVAVLVHPDPGTYCYTVDSGVNTDDASAKVIFNDILRKHSDAWEKLAQM